MARWESGGWSQHCSGVRLELQVVGAMCLQGPWACNRAELLHGPRHFYRGTPRALLRVGAQLHSEGLRGCSGCDVLHRCPAAQAACWACPGHCSCLLLPSVSLRPVNGLSIVPEGGCSLTLEVTQLLLLTSKSVLIKDKPLFRLISMKTALKHRKGRR